MIWELNNFHYICRKVINLKRDKNGKSSRNSND